MPDFVAFSQRWPQIELEIDASYDLADLSKREADVALRFMPRGKLPDQDLAGRLAATAYWAVYGQGDCWIGWTDDAEWIRESEFPELPWRGALNSGPLQRAACLAGMGITFRVAGSAEMSSRATRHIPNVESVEALLRWLAQRPEGE